MKRELLRFSILALVSAPRAVTLMESLPRLCSMHLHSVASYLVLFN